MITVDGSGWKKIPTNPGGFVYQIFPQRGSRIKNWDARSRLKVKARLSSFKKQTTKKEIRPKIKMYSLSKKLSPTFAIILIIFSITCYGLEGPNVCTRQEQ